MTLKKTQLNSERNRMAEEEEECLEMRKIKVYKEMRR